VLQLKRHPLQRYYGRGDLHFITTSCYRRKAFLETARTRDIFLSVLEHVRRRYRFDVIGFVVMPEHVHLLLGEPEKADLSVVMQVLKQRVARRLLHRQRKKNSRQGELWSVSPADERFWQRRFYDFNVFSARKMTEKLTLHAPQSGEAWVGERAGTVALEQLSQLRAGRARTGEHGLDGVSV